MSSISPGPGLSFDIWGKITRGVESGGERRRSYQLRVCGQTIQEATYPPIILELTMLETSAG